MPKEEVITLLEPLDSDSDMATQSSHYFPEVGHCSNHGVLVAA